MHEVSTNFCPPRCEDFITADDTGFVVQRRLKVLTTQRNATRHVMSGLLHQVDATVAADRTLLSLGTQPRPRRRRGHVTLVTIQLSRASCPHATAATAGKTCLLDRTWRRAEPLPRSPALCGFLPFARLRRSVVFLAIATTAHRLADFL